MKIMAFVFTVLMSGAMTAQTTVKKIDTATSNVSWVGKKVTGKHEGNINIKDGMLSFNDGVLSGGEFTIDMTSIVCTDLKEGGAEKLVGHLSSDDFFSVANHPTANLLITNVSNLGDNAYQLRGDLTIKGITKPIEFKAMLDDNGATADIIVDRSKYDIRYGSGSFFDNLGDKTIYDNFELSVALKMAE